MAQKRKEWICWQARCKSEHLVFIDESAAKTNMAPLYGRSLKGERCYGHAPASWSTITMLSSIRQSGANENVIFDGCVNKAIFKDFIEQQLLPTLYKGDIIIMDNHKAHKIKFNLKKFKKYGVTIKYLPPYSPDLNPIEMMWSQVKGKLRHAQARTYFDLWREVSIAHLDVTSENAQGWFRGCGYIH